MTIIVEHVFNVLIGYLNIFGKCLSILLMFKLTCIIFYHWFAGNSVYSGYNLLVRYVFGKYCISQFETCLFHSLNEDIQCAEVFI